MLRDPPHYLKPLKTTTTPKRLIWLSCHGNVHKVRSHSELRFQVACLGRTWWTVRKRERRDTLDTFTDTRELWSEVVSHCAKGKRQVMFTWDLAEQMRISKLLTELPALGWQLDKIVLEKAAAWCLFRYDDRSLMCCDLSSWVNTSWENVIRDVTETGRETPYYRAGPDMRASQCSYRVGVIRAATLQILNWIEGENLGQFRPTGSGQSYAAYRRRFMRGRLLVHDDMQRLDTERKAMHTGRAEAWRHGPQRSGPYVEYDLHAAYATIGRDCSVPTIARGTYRNPTDSRVEKLAAQYALLADCTVETDIECVPYHNNGRTLWPVGRFRTQLWDPELTLALELATSVKVHALYAYMRAPVLHDFCTWVLDSMEGQTQVYGLVPQRVLKHWSRCLVGRLGLRFRAWHYFGVQDPPDVRLVKFYDMDDNTATEMLLAGNRRLLLGEMTESLESLPQVPGWVMSECRRRLWHEMAYYGDQLVYVDTDSVIVRYRDNAVRTAEPYVDQWGTTWRKKGTYDRLTVHGPRNLEIGYSRRVAGLPLSATQTRPLEFDAEVMRGVKHAMLNGELDCVVSMPRTYHLQSRDLRRGHNPDGTTYPFEIVEQTQPEGY